MIWLLRFGKAPAKLLGVLLAVGVFMVLRSLRVVGLSWVWTSSGRSGGALWADLPLAALPGLSRDLRIFAQLLWNPTLWRVGPVDEAGLHPLATVGGYALGPVTLKYELQPELTVAPVPSGTRQIPPSSLFNAIRYAS